MKIYQAYYFVSLCQCQSFTKAAQLCHVSQPALTRAIGALEAELGGALFHRSSPVWASLCGRTSSRL
jgi:LysR family transcriptional regulator, hydrogen peroxide-inducible genes activator